ncbi:hypothetical protein AURDEDRAFT_177219 [Auricularia subglabra TFB-10046 SS5]|uniref:Uncharacterized protein n=1 Tax=Auricularia subglabra (strain TFB-10046 / SS5) TaxID=717982 RepID=J0LB80_AURST|nr:hypothetical protein AURDEDRAFT_177219 [Auricularia subglabra TFB-10046 SS5]
MDGWRWQRPDSSSDAERSQRPTTDARVDLYTNPDLSPPHVGKKDESPAVSGKSAFVAAKDEGADGQVSPTTAQLGRTEEKVVVDPPNVDPKDKEGLWIWDDLVRRAASQRHRCTTSRARSR